MDDLTDDKECIRIGHDRPLGQLTNQKNECLWVINRLETPHDRVWVS